MRILIQYVLKLYYMVLAIIGLTVNLLGIMILNRGKCGLAASTTCYLMAMSIADLLVIITEVVLNQINYYYLPVSFLHITSVCSAHTVLLRAATDCSVWFTVMFSFDRFVAICCQTLKGKYCVKKTGVVVLAITCILLCLKNIPYYFMFDNREIINNIPWFCYPKANFYTESLWVGFDLFNMFLTPFIPFSLILLFNALTVRHILVASRVRKGLRGHWNGGNHNDPEMESRRKSVILLCTISGSFLLLWLTYVIESIYYNITAIDPTDYTTSEYTFQQIGWMLRNLSCCTNTFIYGATQSKFRDQVKSAVKYPIRSVIKLIKNK